jgi:hypothetical protein
MLHVAMTLTQKIATLVADIVGCGQLASADDPV